MTKTEAFQALLKDNGNAFAVAGGVGGTIILNSSAVRNALTKEEVTNLVAWLALVSRITEEEIGDMVRRIVKGEGAGV